MNNEQQKPSKSFRDKFKKTTTYKYQQKIISEQRKKEENERKALIQESRERSLSRIKKVQEKFSKASENKDYDQNREILESFHLRRGKVDDDEMSIMSRPEGMDKLPAHLQYPSSDLNIHEAMNVTGYKVDAKIEKVWMSKSTPQKRPYAFEMTNPPSPPQKSSKVTPVKPPSRLQSTSKNSKNIEKSQNSLIENYSQENQHYQKNFNYYKKFRFELQRNTKLTKKLNEKDEEIEKLTDEKNKQKEDYEKRIESLEGLLRLAIKN